MDRLQTLEVFVAVAEAGGFAAGAKAIGISAPSATRGINLLEERLGARLFTRTTRQVRLTDVGEAYLEDTRRILAALQTADDAVTGRVTNPVGKLRITCSNEFGRIYVLPVVMEYLDRFPDVAVDVVMLDRVVNMIEEGFDIAVRIGQMPSSGLSAVKVGSVRRVVCGSPQYYARCGIPKTPAELASHSIIANIPVVSTNEWRFGPAQGTSVKLAPRLSLSSVAASIEAARSGWGLTRALSYQIGPDLIEGSLQTVLTEFEPEALPINLVHTEGRRAVGKVRSFIDLATERIRAVAVLN